MEQNTIVDESIVTQDVIDLYHEFTHGDGDKRKFMRNLSYMVGGMVSANNLLPVLENNRKSIIISPDDERLISQDVGLSVKGKDVYAYFVRPKKIEGELPCAIIIHENRGLNSHIMDIARRVALEGYLVLAPDAVSLLGRRASNDDEGRQMMRQLDEDEAQQAFANAIDFMAEHELSNGKVATIGFCWGGAISGKMASVSENLDAAVVYYGGRPSVEEVSKISVPMMMHYAEMDKSQMSFIPEYRADLDEANIDYKLKIWWGAQHAFNNNSNQARYHERSAIEAWQQTLQFLNQHLR